MARTKLPGAVSCTKRKTRSSNAKQSNVTQTQKVPNRSERQAKRGRKSDTRWEEDKTNRALQLEAHAAAANATNETKKFHSECWIPDFHRLPIFTYF